jgi:hypothetical protein
MTSGELSSFRAIAEALQAALDNLNGAVESGDVDATNVAHSNLLGALTDAAMASVDALGRFSPFTNPGFFSDEPRDITEVLGAGLDLDGDMHISRELVEALAVVDESHPDNPAHREIAKALAPGVLAMRAVMKLERELIALRNEVRGT